MRWPMADCPCSGWQRSINDYTRPALCNSALQVGKDIASVCCQTSLEAVIMRLFSEAVASRSLCILRSVVRVAHPSCTARPARHLHCRPCLSFLVVVQLLLQLMAPTTGER